MIYKLADGTELIIRYAYEDQFPAGADIRQAARDSVIRYARWAGVEFRWIHDQHGERWKNGVPQRVYGWRSEAVVTGRVATRPAYL